MSTTPPVSLQNLYVELDYLAGIRDRQKYNFTDRTYVNDDWIGFLWRKWGGENQDIYGISVMENICKNAAEQFIQYKNDEVFGNELLDKMVSARHGLERCRVTYESKQKTNTVSNIKNRGILVLDNAIPIERKLKEGIIIRNKTESRERVLSTSQRSPEAKMIIPQDDNDV